jgi:hypothetical protein
MGLNYHSFHQYQLFCDLQLKIASGKLCVIIAEKDTTNE